MLCMSCWHFLYMGVCMLKTQLPKIFYLSKEMQALDTFCVGNVFSTPVYTNPHIHKNHPNIQASELTNAILSENCTCYVVATMTEVDGVYIWGCCV